MRWKIISRIPQNTQVDPVVDRPTEPSKEKLYRSVMNAQTEKMFQHMNNKKVFIIDDDVELHQIINIYLNEDPDISYENFYNEYSVIEKLCKINNVDIILLDINLPSLNGIDLGIILRLITKFDIPIIYISADKSYKKAFQMIDQKNTCFMEKPLQKEMLIGTIHRMLEEKQANN